MVHILSLRIKLSIKYYFVFIFSFKKWFCFVLKVLWLCQLMSNKHQYDANITRQSGDIFINIPDKNISVSDNSEAVDRRWEKW